MSLSPASNPPSVLRAFLGVFALIAVVFAPVSALALAPAAPANVKAHTTRDRASNATYWLVTWEDRAFDEVGYVVKGRYLSGSQVVTPYYEFAREGANATSAIITLEDNFNALPNLSLQFQVTAFKNNGAAIETSSATSAKRLFLGTETFTTPTNLSITKVAGTDGTYDIKFDDNSSVEIWHRIQYKLASAADWNANNEFQLSFFGESDIRRSLQLTPGVNYHFRVRAQNFTGFTDYSNIVDLTTENMVPPTELTATAISDSIVRLQWKDNSTFAMGYEMQYRFNDTESFIALNSGGDIIYAGGNDSGYDVAVGPGTEIQWRVRAVAQNEAETLVYSAFTNTATVSSLFAAPSSVEAVATGLSGSIAVRWVNNSTYTTSYEVLGKEAGTTDEYAALATVPASATETLITGLTVNEEIEVVVRSLGSGGASYLSSAVLVTPGHGFTPAAYRANLDTEQFGLVLLTPLNVAQNAAAEVFKATPFSHTLSVTNNAGVNAWSVTGLPAGFTPADVATQTFSGTPTEVGVVRSLATASYSDGRVASAKFVFRVQQPPTAPVVNETLTPRTIGLSSPLAVSLTGAFTDPDTPRAARFVTSLGEMKFSLFEQVTPQAVANFLAYVSGGDYDGVAFHRSFPPGAGPNNGVFALVERPDGRFVAGGDFSTYNTTNALGLVRVNGDGTADAGFSSGGGADNRVKAVAVDENGAFVLGGEFNTFQSLSRPKVARVSSNGTVDASFNPGSGADGSVNAVATIAGSQVYIAGAFANYNGTATNRVARLNTDGSLDGTFDVGAGPDGDVTCLVALPDGKVLIAGLFTTVAGTPRAGMARLESNGTLDMTFDPGTGADGSILALAKLASGKVLIGGSFSNFNGVARSRVAGLNDNGTLDLGFDPGAGANGTVNALRVLASGKVLIGGDFTEFNGNTVGRLARIESNGTFDSTFSGGAGANGAIHAMTELPDGQLVVGGVFSEFAGAGRRYLVRLSANGQVDTSYNPGFVVQGGGFRPITAPNVFETVDQRPSPRNEPGVGNYRGFVAAAKVGGDPNSATHDFFLNLGDNSANLDLQNNGFTVFGRIVGSGLNVMDAISAKPTKSYTIVVDGASANYTDWPMNETPAPVAMDISKTIKILDAEEISPLTYSVTNNTAPGVVGAVVSGGQLQLTGISAGSADITVTATDLEGNSVGQTFTVQVAEGQQAVVINTQPANQSVVPGSDVTFSVVATGTNLNYQWRRNGQDLGAPNASSLTLLGVSSGDQASYDVVVSNATNTVVSASATLVVTEGAMLGSQPVPRIIQTGQPLSMSVTTSGTPTPTVTWTKNNQAITATGPTITVASATLADAGNYQATVTNSSGSVPSDVTPVVVVDGSYRRFVVKTGMDLNLSALTNQPSGIVLTYQWKDKNGVNVVPGLRFAGVTTSKLVMRGVNINDVGAYKCLITGPMGSVLTGEFDVVVAATPEVNNFTLPDAFVAQDYDFTVPFNTAKSQTPTKITATGLPAGLKINSVTGRITGRPIKRGNHTVKVVASNPAGASVVKSATLRVIPMPSTTTGVYIGLLARQAQVNKSCGGRVDLKVTDTGAYTGKVVLPGKTHSIRGKVQRTVVNLSSTATTVMLGTVVLKQTGQLNLEFTFLVNATNGTLSGELVINDENFSSLTGWKNVWNAKYAPAAEFGLTGVYHFGMDIPAASVGNIAVPQGSGYASLTVSNSGVAKVKGRTIDNKVILCSGPMGPAGSFIVFQQFSKKAGSLQGPLAIAQRDADLVGGVSHSDIVTVPGFAFDQFKNAAPTDRDYPAGYAPAIPLTVMGGTYIKPQASARNAMSRLISSTGGVDLTFNANLLADNAVLKIVKQADGKLLVGGVFSRFGDVSRNGIVRLSADGVLDETFDPGTGVNGAVYDMVQISDGKILVVGAFTTFNGTARNRVARLNANGSLDASFNPGTGPNSIVECLAVQADGKVVIGGQFGQVNGVARAGVARLNNDGSADASFNPAPGTGTEAAVRCVVIQPDQKILIGGDFTTFVDSVSTHSRNRIARLNTDGRLDTAFNPGTGATSTVRAIAIQTVSSTERVLIGGSFAGVGGANRSGVARLLTTGAIDSGFDPGFGTNGDVFAVKVLTGNSVAIGGTFSRFNNIERNGIAIVNETAGLKVNFNPPAGSVDNNGNNSVRTILEQSDKVIMGGWVQTRTAVPRVMWLTPSKNDVTVTFTQGKLSTAPVSNPIAGFEISATNAGVPKSGNTGGVTWSYNAATGIVSGQFSPDVSGVKRIAKYSALLVPLTPSDMRGMGSFDLPELPNGTTITSKNAPIHTGKVVISPEP